MSGPLAPYRIAVLACRTMARRRVLGWIDTAHGRGQSRPRTLCDSRFYNISYRSFWPRYSVSQLDAGVNYILTLFWHLGHCHTKRLTRSISRPHCRQCTSSPMINTIQPHDGHFSSRPTWLNPTNSRRVSHFTHVAIMSPKTPATRRVSRLPRPSTLAAHKSAKLSRRYSIVFCPFVKRAVS